MGLYHYYEESPLGRAESRLLPDSVWVAVEWVAVPLLLALAIAMQYRADKRLHPQVSFRSPPQALQA